MAGCTTRTWTAAIRCSGTRRSTRSGSGGSLPRSGMASPSRSGSLSRSSSRCRRGASGRRAGVLAVLVRAIAAVLLAARAVAALVVRAGRQLVVRDLVLGALVVAHPHGLTVGIGARHHDRALAGPDARAHGGHLRGTVAVLRQLVRQTAHEPAAGAGDLRRVQRQVLLARHLQCDRVEALHPGRAAERAAARAAAIQPLRLVANADLAELDAGLEPACQVLHQLAEVHALLGREVERDPVAAERHLDLGELHLELAELHPLAAVVERLRLEREVLVLLVEVLLLGLADDLARDAAGTLELDERRVLEEHGAHRLAVLTLDDDPVAEAQPQVARVQEEFPARAAQGDLVDLRHDRTSMASGCFARLTPPGNRRLGIDACSGIGPRPGARLRRGSSGLCERPPIGARGQRL